MTEFRQNAARPADPLAQLNDPGEVFRNPSQVEFIRTLIQFVRDAFSRTIFRDQAAPDIMLLAPSGQSFRVTVGDDGTLRTEPVTRG